MTDLVVRLRRLAIPLSIGILLIFIASLGMAYIQQISNQDELRYNITLMSRIASQTQRSAKDIEEKVQSIQKKIPTENLKETDVYGAVLGLAAQVGVKAEVSYRTTGTRQVLQSKYRVLLFGVTATGGYNEVHRFIKILDREQTLLETMVLENLKISGGEKSSTVAMDIIIYIRAA